MSGAAYGLAAVLMVAVGCLFAHFSSGREALQPDPTWRDGLTGRPIERGAPECQHLVGDLELVTSLSGEIVAGLCTACDAQLPADSRPVLDAIDDYLVGMVRADANESWRHLSEEF